MDEIHLVEFIQLHRGLRAVCHTHITWTYNTYEELSLLLVHWCFCCGSAPVVLYIYFKVTALAREQSYPKCKYIITIHWWRQYEQNGTETNKTVNGSIVDENTFTRLWCNNSYDNHNTYNWRACGLDFDAQRDPLYLYPYNSQRKHVYHIMLFSKVLQRWLFILTVIEYRMKYFP